jgi:hypothetical protein
VHSGRPTAATFERRNKYHEYLYVGHATDGGCDAASHGTFASPCAMARPSAAAFAALASVLLVFATVVARAQARRLPDAPRLALRADVRDALDPVAQLQARLDAGEISLMYDSAFGYLPALLTALDIPRSSQGLVFSRTSLQTDKITPWSPRALYFTDDVYIGYVYSPRFRHEIPNKERYRAEFDLTTESDRTSLEGKFDPAAYLSAHSDIVALMVLVHQTTVHNYLAGLHEIAEFTPDAAEHDGSAESTRLHGAVERLLRAMLFVQEAPLAGPMRGTTSFATDFAALGPRDARGRSLRDFDLETRLFRYPLSFLIYSESMDALPAVAQRVFYRRLEAILQGAEQEGAYAHLQPADRLAIREILRSTKPAYVSSAGR